jgi:hypothetical protein
MQPRSIKSARSDTIKGTRTGGAVTGPRTARLSCRARGRLSEDPHAPPRDLPDPSLVHTFRGQPMSPKSGARAPHASSTYCILKGLASITLALSLAACSTAATSSDTQSRSTITVAPITPSPVPTNADGTPYVAPDLNPGEESYATSEGIVKFGTTYVWGTGVRMSVSAPQAFEPTEYANVTPQLQNVFVTVTITNGTGAVLEPYAYLEGSSGGAEVSNIYDSGNPMGPIGASPSASILPGGAITWLEAFSIQDVNTLLLQGSPTMDLAETIWTDQ